MGVLVANKGKWGNEQIVQADYVEKLLARKVFDFTDSSPHADSYRMLWYKPHRTFKGEKIDCLWASGMWGNALRPFIDLCIALTGNGVSAWNGVL